MLNLGNSDRAVTITQLLLTTFVFFVILFSSVERTFSTQIVVPRARSIDPVVANPSIGLLFIDIVEVDTSQQLDLVLETLLHHG